MPKTVTISPAVAEVLARATVSGPSITLPEGQLDRTLYEAVNKVLVAMGGKWNRSAKAHVFANGIPVDIADAIAAGHVVDQKKTLEQFYTPAGLAARMCDEIGIGTGDKVLEPSAGRGAIVEQLLRRGADVIAIEIDPANVAALDDLHRRGASLSVVAGDFLEITNDAPEPRATTAVVMNPPFSRNQDIAHVRRAFDMLAPGGRLAAIMSTHWTFAPEQACVDFRAWTGLALPLRHADAARGSINRASAWPMNGDQPGAATDISVATFDLLPAGTFKESGTNVAAVLVVLRKAA